MKREYLKLCQRVYNIDKKAGLSMMFEIPYYCDHFIQSDNLAVCFSWQGTKEGKDFWGRLADQLEGEQDGSD